MLCQPIIPKNTTITDDQLQNFDTFGKLLAYSSNPVERYNRANLNTITSKVNVIVKGYDKTPYPILEARLKQGALTVTEVAEFMSQYFYVEQELLNFVTTVPATSDVTKPLVDNLEYFLDKNMSSAMTGSFCSAFSNPFQKIMELAMFIDGAKTLIEQLRNFDIASVLAPLFAVKEMIFNMIDNLAKQLIAKVNSIVGNVVSQIQNLKTAADRMFKFINKKAQEIKEFFNDLSLEKLKTMAEDIITKMAGQFEKLTPEIIAFLLFRVCQLIETIKNLLENPVKALEGLVTNMMTNTRNISSESARRAQVVINNGGIFIPVQDRESVRTSAANAINEKTNNSPMPAPPLNRNTVGDCTAPTGSTSTGGGNVNLTPGSYVTLPMAPEEQRWVQNLTSEGDRFIQFNPSVKDMGANAVAWWNASKRGPFNPEENFPDAGWKMIVNVNPFIFAALARVSSSMNRTLYLNSCFRSPYYNWYLKNVQGSDGVAENSFHTKAMAVDISTRNMSDDEVAYLIQYASREGFNRMSVYGTFVHVDIAAGNYRGNWTNNYRGNRNIQEAMQIHLRDGFRRG